MNIRGNLSNFKEYIKAINRSRHINLENIKKGKKIVSLIDSAKDYDTLKNVIEAKYNRKVNFVYESYISKQEELRDVEFALAKDIVLGTGLLLATKFANTMLMNDLGTIVASITGIGACGVMIYGFADGIEFARLQQRDKQMYYDIGRSLKDEQVKELEEIMFINKKAEQTQIK